LRSDISYEELDTQRETDRKFILYSFNDTLPTEYNTMHHAWMVTSDQVEISRQIEFMIGYLTLTSFDWEEIRNKVNIACFLAHGTNQAHEQIPESHEDEIYNVYDYLYDP
jgi:hypothetical protein